MFEPTWYRCAKLARVAPDSVGPDFLPGLRLLEQAAASHVLKWLGLR
jgi:hypothetical protein